MNSIESRFKKVSIYFLMVVLLCSLSSIVKAQAPDSKGTDFWLTFPGNYNGGATLSLFISGDQNTTGTVTITGLGFSTPFTVTPGAVTTVSIPAAADLGSGSSVITNKGIHVVATQEVTVYGLSRIIATTDAYLGLPTDILGTDYINLGYKNVDVVNGTQMAIVGTQNATTVTITPSVTTDGHAAGVPYNITLNQGETFQLRNTNPAPNDLSGTLVSSTKPIAVFGSHQCANIPNGSTYACDFVVEELPPTTAWGKNFVTVPLKTRIGGDSFRFLASTNGTQVRINGTLVTTLNRGQIYETLINGSSQITSTQPILVAQYSNGTTFDNVTSDPFMMLISPYEQFLGNYTFATPASGFSFNFVNVVAPAAAVGALKLDGVTIPSSAFTPIGSSGFSGAQLNLSLGSHTINGTNLPFGIFVYGFDQADSYGYPGGQSLSPVATVSTLTITPKTGTAPVGTSQCFDALVKDQFGVVVAGVRVDFNITGANPGSTGFANTNASGIAHFCYTGTNTGTDNIVASVGTVNDAASFVWTPAVSNIYYSKSSGDLHDVLTWGLNPDGSGANPSDFGDSTFQLANRPGVYTMTGNWTVGGTINIPLASELQINGFTLSEAALAGPGTVTGSLTSNLIVTGNAGGDAGMINFTSGSRLLNNLTVDRTGALASATIGTSLSLYGVLTLTNGTLNTNNQVTLKSNAATTARVAPVTGGVNGNITVERYIPARRAWRILSAPVSGSQTINQGWQEGAILGSSANPNPAPGFGTHITGGPTYGSTANGFDQNPGAASSIKTYSSTLNNWVELPNTNATPIGADAYMTFIRGDRGLPIGSNTVPPTVTTLRATGSLKVGDQVFNVSGSGFTGIPNPFASPINFATITRSGVQNNFYLWDPKMGGVNGVGAYVLLSFNGSGYDITPAAVSPESQYIQSGQGFLVRPEVSGVPGTITIKESDKSATAATDVFRVGSSNMPAANNSAPVMVDPKSGQGLRITLTSSNADQTTGVLDEVFSSYKSNYSNKIDNLDAVKMPNMQENLAIVMERQDFMVDRRQLPAENDVIALKLWNTTPKTYTLEFNPVGLAGVGITAFLEDKYLKTSTPVSLNNLSQVQFTITSDMASARTDRFQVILIARKPLTDLVNVPDKALITAYPNPINGKQINLWFNNEPAGTYQAILLNTAGQIIFRKNIQYGGGSGTQVVELDRKPQPGVYQLQVSGTSDKANIKLISN